MFKISYKFNYFLFVFAACISVLAASIFSKFIEVSSKNYLKAALHEAGYSWVKVNADGLLLFLHGDAPSDFERIEAVKFGRSMVTGQRLIDNISHLESSNNKTGEVNLKILKSIGKVFFIGSFPKGFASFDFEEMLKTKPPKSEEYHIIVDQTDMASTLNWELITSYALSLVDVIKLGKIETDGKQLFVEGIASDNSNHGKLKEYIKSRAPPNLPVEILFYQPRELISPFTFQIEIKNGLLQYSDCVVADEESKNRIAKIAEKLSARAVQECLVGLGEPSPQWAEAVEKAFSISPRLLNAKVVFDNLNISVILDHSFAEKEYTEILNSISNTLPPEFVLSFIKLSNDGGSDLSSNRVVATLSPEGLLKIVGPIGEELDKELVANFAKVRFGSENTSISLYKVGSLPDDWVFRIIAGLEGLQELKNGILNVTPNLIEIRGKTYKKFSPAKITKVVGDKIGYDQRLSLSVDYIDMPKPLDDSLTSSQCINKIEETLRVRKIKFEPGSDRVDLAGHETLDDIAKILLNCGDIRLEIGGHTDSQGREQMNLNLSQSRANSVLFELQRRRVLTKNIIAKGYGESQPIASNDTEQGREINRRIEFTPFDKSMGTTVAPKDDIRN